MIRICTVFALVELALLGAVLGLPTAQADPAEECCAMPRGEECSGCLAGYLLPRGYLYGCMTTGLAMGCENSLQICNGSVGGIIKWREGSNCTVYQELSLGILVQMPGCTPTVCD
jgi:hypothetical protein